MSSLPVKYRPNKFEDVCGQGIITKILEKQVETEQFKNCYLFSGSSGCGKTTTARILAYKINEYKDSAGNLCSSEPIEIDAASNNGVDSIRAIVDSASERSLDGKYKIFIIDECHAITSQGWQPLLKCLEEAPKYTIFMFCTTEYHKVPDTIKNRCQQFNIKRISDTDIVNRLDYICWNEHFTTTKEALTHIAKLSQGSMRLAISNLEKCASYSTDISIENVMSVLGDFSYEVYFDLINSIIDKDSQKLVSIIEKLYMEGSDLKLFLDMFIDFVLDLSKYTIFHSYDIISIPQSCDEKLKYTTNVEGATKYFNHVIDKLLSAKVTLKTDNNVKTTLEILLLNL